MPIEVLTREEIEKIVEEKLKKLLLDMGISQKIAQVESTAAKLEDDLAKRSISPTVTQAVVAEPEPIVAALTRDLTQLEDLLQIGMTSTSVTLKPKAYLGASRFRAVSEIVRRYGGSWSSDRKMFIISKRGSPTVSTI